MSEQFQIKFKASGRGTAQCPSNPDYPNGIALDVSDGASQSCIAKLPYPAPECGLFVVNCKLCETTIAVTSVGRPDDPISVKIACDARGVSNSSPKGKAE